MGEAGPGAPKRPCEPAGSTQSGCAERPSVSLVPVRSLLSILSDRRRSHAVRGAFALALLASGPLGCGRGDAGGPERKGPPPANVEVVTVEAERLRETLDLVGQLEPEESVEIRSEVAGVVESVSFAEGQEVKRGDVLFALRDADQVAGMHEARADLALAADVHRRTRELASRSVAAAAQLEKASAELAAAQARLERAQVALARTRIRAPFDGVMGRRRVSPGDGVDTREILGQIDAVARVQLIFSVPEIAIPLMKQGATVDLSVAPYPGERFTGEVFFVAPTLDPATRRMVLKAWIPNPDRKLRPGLFANIQIDVGERENAIVVPEEAIAYDAGGSFVWRLGADQLAERVAVELGQRRAGRVEVTRGLSPGETVVASGVHKVVAGAAVVPVNAPAAAPAADRPEARATQGGA